MQEFNAGEGWQFQLQTFLYGYCRIQNEQRHSNKYHFYHVFWKRINDVKHKERGQLPNFQPMRQLPARVYRRSIFKIRPNILIGAQKLRLRPKDRSRSPLFIYSIFLRQFSWFYPKSTYDSLVVTDGGS